ncbi:Actin- protein 6 [Stylosanthes scabra]|uniref:Actin- protein 6 n=1 Tax=Stylosanthes scabra TaxID=79078 RepID=A0ABU6Y3F5_9FABA|nr:Actin- protein 6 [Stylosanthes scabra]
MSATNVVVLDNGGGLIKAGFGGERDPAAILPNCLYRSPASKKWLHPHPLPTTTSTDSAASEPDLTSAAVRRPFDRGYLINSDLQREIWSHLFSSILRINPTQSSLLVTEPLFTLPSIQRSLDELVFEDFNFRALYVADSPSLVHLYEASRRPDGLVSRAQCSLVVDCGFSFTHASPVFQNFTLNYGVKRIDLGGKALTNYLKELVSFRSVNVMEETFLIDDVKEKLCFVSLDVPRDLRLARESGRQNPFRCTYVLPDGITYTKGFVKYPERIHNYLALKDGNGGFPPVPEETKENMNPLEMAKLPQDRNRIDLSKNEFDLTNERFLVPEMMFHPANLGMNEAGLAECIVRAVNSCHPHLHPVLYESIILTGGSTLFPQFAERLEKELRPLVPDDYHVKITTQEDPILGVWRGGSLLASSPDFEAMCVTKSEYEEHGSARCRKRFFH